MIAALIRWSVANRVLVVIAALIIALLGAWSVKETPVDALPDLSDVQVIVKTSFPGQAPQVVEDQVTYPLTTAMLSVPKAVTVRRTPRPMPRQSRNRSYRRSSSALPTVRV